MNTYTFFIVLGLLLSILYLLFDRRLWLKQSHFVQELQPDLRRLFDLLLIHHEGMNKIQSANERLHPLSDSMELLAQRMSKIEDTIQSWAEEKIKNEAKKGEANRTLRRHLKDARENLVVQMERAKIMENEIEEYHRVLAYERAAYKDLRANLCQELSLIKSWLSEHRINTQKLDSYLKTEFKGNIPSKVYRQELDEAAMQKSLLRFANDE
ncbi:MAG: hypothetical protein WCY84_00345 [Candidatus Cloacimonadaceae bacterium]